jgi:hypothetical protein
MSNRVTAYTGEEMKKTAQILFLIAASYLAGTLLPPLARADAPAWVHAAANAPVPAHDEKADAVLLYAEDIVSVQSENKLKRIQRRVYKILRPAGREYGTVRAGFDPNNKINSIRGWCIPAQGKDYEVKDKDAVEVSLSGVEYSDLINDVKEKLIRIPAPEPGNVVGFEIESEEHPFILQDWWDFQDTIPVREARYTLQLPPGWEYKAAWINSTEIQPAPSGNNQWQWVVSDIKPIRHEDYMPPWRGISSQVIISFLPPGGSNKKGFENWAEMGRWENDLTQGRRDPSPELKQKVAELTANVPTTLGKMQALANFIQQNIRYVAIELGIGGLQPHAARDVFAHKYGDCKDKATVLSAMLKEIGVDSYYVAINTVRGGVNAQTPPQMFWFNHMILAIRLPDDVKSPSLLAIYNYPTLGRLLIFDPTDEMTPLGQVRGDLQANYGLLIAPDGGGLIQVPQLSASMSGVHRSGKLSLRADGTLQGDITEAYFGDQGRRQRYELHSVSKSADRIKPIETLLSQSLGTYQITKASLADPENHEAPFEYKYSFVAEKYAKNAGPLLLVRPRLVDSKSSGLLEGKEPRRFPVEFRGPHHDADTYEIALPAGYVVDDLPPPVDADYSFASYHSKTESKGDSIVYSRSFEIKELSVPVAKLDELKTLYRIIASDERNTAVLKPAGH